MSIIETMGRMICETHNVDGFKCTCPLAGEPEGNSWCNGDRPLHQARAALRAIKPSNISDGMVEAYLRAHGGSDESVKKALFMGVNDFRRAIAAAIAAGAEQ